MFKRFLGVLFVVGAVLVLPMLFLAFFDPTAFKAVDETDPFGAPPSRFTLALAMVITTGIGVFGARLLKTPKKNSLPGPGGDS